MALTLVLVPGLGLGAEAWAPTLRRSAYAGEAVVRCLPGYGEPAGGADLRPRALAERLLGETPRGADLVLAGHSASCQVVSQAAVLAGVRVRGLLLVGPTTDPRAPSWARLAGRWLRTAGHEPPWQLPALARQYGRTGLPSMWRAMDAARRDRIDVALHAWGGPALVVRGRHDRICPDDWGRALAAQSPGGSLASLSRGGHMVPLTHGDLVAPLLDALVSRVGRGPAQR